MSNIDDKKINLNNLVLLKSTTMVNKKIELTDSENELKNKLCDIENKLASVKNVFANINAEKTDTIYNSDTFRILIGSIAITAALNTLAEYLGVNLEDVNKLIE